MKILFLNPLVDAQHQLVRSLREKGFGVILASHPAEAMEALRVHGRTIELAIIHREPVDGGVGEPGLEFIKKFRQDPDQSDLPYVLTSGQWGAKDFTDHQSSAFGAHGYLKFPCAFESLLSTMEKMFGNALYAPDGAPTVKPLESVRAPAEFSVGENENGLGELVLEEMGLEPMSAGGTVSAPGSIMLEMPEIAGEPALEAESESATGIQLDGTSEEGDATKTTTKKKSAKKKTKDSLSSEADRLLRAIQKTAKEGADEQAKASESDAELDRLLEGTRVRSGDRAEDPDSIFDRKSMYKTLLDDSPLQQEERAQSELVNASDQEQKIRSEIEQELLAREMPYLFGAGSGTKMNLAPKAASYDPIIPLGDAVVPGGAANTPDEDTIRKFLELREQDVAALSAQLKTAREQIASLEETLKKERAQGEENRHKLEEQSLRIQEFEKEKEVALEAIRNEIEEIRFQGKAKSDRVRVLEHRVKDATLEAERLKERVRMDIRKIRIREKELENRLEIMRRDSEALIGARENKIIELKRKMDLLEFNMDLLQDQYTREKENSHKLRERFSRALQAVRVAGGLLDNAPVPVFEEESDEADEDGVSLEDELQEGLPEESDEASGIDLAENESA